MQAEGWEKEQVGKVSAVEVCWELSKPLHLLGNSSERDMVTLLTATQLSQATIYEKQLTPEQGRAKRELQKTPHGPTVRPRHLPRASGDHGEHCPPTWGGRQVSHGTPKAPSTLGGAATNIAGSLLPPWLERVLLLQIFWGETQRSSCQRKHSFTTNNTSKGTGFNYSIN